jgi:hypothetical protein
LAAAQRQEHGLSIAAKDLDAGQGNEARKAIEVA